MHLAISLQAFFCQQAVREVIQRMMKLGIRLREDTFNTLMNAALENDNTEVVPSMFNQLLSLNLRPDSLSYTALITALARMSRTEAAVSCSAALLGNAAIAHFCKQAAPSVKNLCNRQEKSSTYGCNYNVIMYVKKFASGKRARYLPDVINRPLSTAIADLKMICRLKQQTNWRSRVD